MKKIELVIFMSVITAIFGRCGSHEVKNNTSVEKRSLKESWCAGKSIAYSQPHLDYLKLTGKLSNLKNGDLVESFFYFKDCSLRIMSLSKIINKSEQGIKILNRTYKYQPYFNSSDSF